MGEVYIADVVNIIDKYEGHFTLAQKDMLIAKILSKTVVPPDPDRSGLKSNAPGEKSGDEAGLKVRGESGQPPTGDVAGKEAGSDVKARRLSVAERKERRQSFMEGSSDPEVQKFLVQNLDEPEIKVTGLGDASQEQCVEAGQQLVGIIRNSGGDVVGDIKVWVAKSLPTGNMTQKEKEI